MNLLILLLLLLCLWGANITVRGRHPGYIGREQTTAIKGIFAVLILYSHGRGYLTPEAAAFHSDIFYGVLDSLGQLIVVMFLLYSGYGIMEALKCDRRKYTATFLNRRFFRVWIMFMVAVAMYMVLNLCLGRHYSLADNLLSLVGWKDVGNSNWFICAILLLYLLTYAVLKASERYGLSLHRCVGIIYVLTIGLIITLACAGKGAYWYDTVLAYPTGMLYSLYKTKIERLLNGWRWIAATVLLGGLFVLFHGFAGYTPLAIPTSGRHLLQMLCFVTSSSLFALLIVVLTMKLRLSNPVLNWLGVNAFAIYILQRLPMILFSHLGLHTNALAFYGAVILATLLLAAAYTPLLTRPHNLPRPSPPRPSPPRP